MVVFDVDGVLLEVEKGGFKEVAEFLGKEKEVAKLHAEYEKRKNKGPWGLEQLAELFKNYKKTYLLQIASGYIDVRLAKNVKQVISKLKQRKIIVGAISSNPQFILEVLAKKLNLDFVAGNILQYKHNIATGKLKRKVDRYVKPEVLKNYMKKYKVSGKDVVVVGDSITDIPMGEIAGLFIAFNPKNGELEKEADVIINSRDMKSILKYL
ncbi:hypothetical protein A2300_02160 [Candidatus Falkowbacteria bacterium RIFOXYB2_FULL_35_7]|uniref:phosphoserine phosphatase n=1 Tax=Candidatus Falkowbacteria bacterium RIFOXYC2_FULL_36_12 TaxID=1798002 RepID=A0A1F5SWJ1_9BACT|nr:MAG: hypothetical protein A2300_02160 [Candidatus Falkowbacteria bacterium RIFOXYB2_FULL_35_7]OGF31009.1 MAG: hypothetical protein A2478_01035 [Candidatus Falkowbacteria bacterium RIFOXYC2_FULL_36_12]